MLAFHFFTLLLLSLVSSSVSAVRVKSKSSSSLSSSSSSSSKECTLELQRILYKPKTCTYDYLVKISRNLNIMDIASFQNIYNAVVYLTNVAGARYVYIDGVAYSTTSVYPHGYSAANLNFGGYTFAPFSGFAYFTFTAQDDSGIFYYVTVSIPLTDQPAACGCN
jgi:hypothetical protein